MSINWDKHIDTAIKGLIGAIAAAVPALITGYFQGVQQTEEKAIEAGVAERQSNGRIKWGNVQAMPVEKRPLKGEKSPTKN